MLITHAQNRFVGANHIYPDKISSFKKPQNPIISYRLNALLPYHAFVDVNHHYPALICQSDHPSVFDGFCQNVGHHRVFVP
ncbi:hypothetical protein [Moraxella lacunata]|uniref:hypothetical protein n=1 Tax=Moraxella lacunata TaxID=477 RepID=UPI003EDF867D